ncbi:MAG: hypothetical protein CG439_208 [Methylococcaceae bacterium NSP1-2]|nr:tetratricopeptide repeat protein [Methylococcaceae bacterium]OYV21095.1 MAG: hypothetical protein CG439_208 [Methylococcaceae bacterium NSP1-2]
MRFFWALLGLSVPVVLLYTQFLDNPLVFDDAGFFHSEEFSVYLHRLFSFNLRWLPLATFVWTRQVFGDAIIWLRLGNLLFPLLTTATLFFFLRRLFELVMPPQVDNKTLSAFWLAFFAALIFALHPVSVYAVAYLVQRTTLMATLFTLLTWRLFLEGLIREHRLWLYASAFTYFLAVMSKEHALMAPAVTVALLLLVSSQPLQRTKLVSSTFVLYALIGAFAVFQRQSEHILGQAYEPIASELISRMGADFDVRFIYPLSILTQSFTFFKYLWVWIVPSPALMSVDSCQTFALHFWSWPEALGLVGFVIYPYIAIRLLLQRGLKGLFGFALLCPWLLFFTELATVRIQEIFVLYRSYLWMVGLFASLPFVCQKLTAKQAIITLSCVAILMMPLTWFRLTTFSHPLLLWDDAARRIHDDNNSCPVMDRILNNRGRHLMELGRYPEAIDDLTRSLKVIKWQQKPMVSALADNYYNRGFAYLKTQQFQLALNDFNTIVGTIPKEWSAFYFYKAQAFEGLHELTAARQLYEQACLNGVSEGCEKQKELESTIK